MILIKPKHPKRRYCYGGSGILDIFKNVINKTTTSTLAKKVVNATTKDGLEKVIKRAANSKAAHKVADAVLNGATNATEKLIENVITDAIKRKSDEPTPHRGKKSKTGFGIVLD